MKILVTGGTGFVGSYVLRALVRQGYDNILASKRSTSRMTLVQDIKKVQWVECDLLDVTEMEEILQDCDTVIHIAGMVSFAPWKKEELFRTNVDVTANLINLSLDTGISRFIHFSSVAALGSSKNVIDETAVWTEHNSSKYYSLSKYLGEREAWRGFAEGLNVSIINPSFVLGASYWKYGPMKLFAEIEKGLKFYPIGSNGCVDVRDVADMTLKILESDELAGRRFICSGHNISHYDMMSHIASAFNQNPPQTPIKGLLGTLVWRGTSLAAQLKGKEPLLAKEGYEITSGHYRFDNSQSKKLLGFEYRTLESTIHDTVECYNKTRSEGFGILT